MKYKGNLITCPCNPTTQKSETMINRNIKICAWNINGCFSRTIGVKFFDQDFIRVIQGVDVLCLTETHTHDGNIEYLNIPGFHLLGYKNREKNVKSNTAPGGIAIFARENVAGFFTILTSDSENSIWMKLKKSRWGHRKIFTYQPVTLAQPERILIQTQKSLNLAKK